MSKSRGLLASLETFVSEHARGVPFKADRQSTAIILIDEAAAEITRLREDNARLRSALKEREEALEAISSQALCYGMRANETELRDWLKFIAETAEAALARASLNKDQEG